MLFINDIIRRIEVIWLSAQGRVYDHQWHEDRPRFSTKGTVKAFPSVLPGVDVNLKRVAKKFGGWRKIASNTFEPPQELYEELESIGFSRAEFKRSREFHAPGGWLKD